jgi:hypothetical protein
MLLLENKLETNLHMLRYYVYVYILFKAGGKDFFSENKSSIKYLTKICVRV